MWQAGTSAPRDGTWFVAAAKDSLDPRQWLFDLLKYDPYRDEDRAGNVNIWRDQDGVARKFEIWMPIPDPGRGIDVGDIWTPERQWHAIMAERTPLTRPR